ncbi:glycosyltransferase family 4 protein [Planctomycetota bacterium]|nr:glycosyltransferase family 4 protein [Planctomycetota bacterium]
MISAYSCEPGRGSEGEIGWRTVLALAEQHDVCVLTRANNKAVHERAFAAQPRPERLTFEYFDLPWIFRFYKRGKRFYLIYYYLWQVGLIWRARRVCSRFEPDVVHHLVGGMDWMHAGVAWCPAPFVWGPVGSEETDQGVFKYLNRRERLKARVRRGLRGAIRSLDPLNRWTARKAEVILSHTAETLPRRLSPKLVSFPQTAIVDSTDLARPRRSTAPSAALKLVFAGELIDWKGPRIALEGALKYFERGGQGQMTMVGDGPLRESLEAKAERSTGGDRVNFTGRVTMPELIDVLSTSDVFVYPSYHHGLATVVLQAMLTGLPTVCISGDATGRAIKNHAGITVSVKSEEHPATGIADALAALSADEDLRRRLGAQASALVRDKYTYGRQVEGFESVYEGVLRSVT